MKLATLQEHFIGKKDNRFTPEEARAIWEHMKKYYIDKGADFIQAAQMTGDDLGLNIKQVQEAVITPKTKMLADEVWKKNNELTRRRNAVKRYAETLQKSGLEKTLTFITGFAREGVVFGHGGVFVGSHAGLNLITPGSMKQTVQSFFNAWKFSFGNANAYNTAMEILKNNPNYILAQRAGLKNNPDTFNEGGEINPNNSKLDWIRSSGERGFNALKILRQGISNDFYNRLNEAEKLDSEVHKVIAELTNLATGATNYKVNPILNETLFGAGLELSRWEKIVKNPAKATVILSKMAFSNDSVRPADRVFLRFWGRRVGTQMAMYGGALFVAWAVNKYFLGYDDEDNVNYTDPSKADFMQLKVAGNTMYITSGMAQSFRLVSEIGDISAHQSDTKYLRDRYHDARSWNAITSVSGKYGRGKLAPFYAHVLDAALGSNYRGQAMPWNDDENRMSYLGYALSFSPIPINDLYTEVHDAHEKYGGSDKMWQHMILGGARGTFSGLSGFRISEFEYDSEKSGKSHKRQNPFRPPNFTPPQPELPPVLRYTSP